MGYVFDDNITSAREGIGGYIQFKAYELKIKPPKKLKPSNIIPDNLIDEAQTRIDEFLESKGEKKKEEKRISKERNGVDS